MNHNLQQYSVRTVRTAGLAIIDYKDIIEHIRDLYLWFAPASTEDDIHERLYRHPNTHIDLLFDTTSNQCCGFSIYYTEQYNGFRIMFRDGTVVRDRSKGLYRLLLQNSINPEEQDFVVAMTQNPRVYATLRSFSATGAVYPSPHEKPSNRIKQIASKFCKAPGMDVDTLVVSEVYSGINKSDDFKTVKDSCTAEFFAKTLGKDDGFLVVVPLR